MALASQASLCLLTWRLAQNSATRSCFLSHSLDKEVLEAATKHAPSFCCIRGWPSLFGIQAGWCCTWSWLATDLPPLFVPLGTNDSSDLVLAPYTCWYRFSSSSSESSKVAWVSSVSVPRTPDFPPQWMLRTRAEAFWAYAPLLGSASHPAPGLANQLQVKLRPHPGVFVDDLSATLLLY